MDNDIHHAKAKLEELSTEELVQVTAASGSVTNESECHAGDQYPEIVNEPPA